MIKKVINLQFIQIPAFNDNYIWLIEESGHAWVVDPGDPQVVIDYLEQHQILLDGALITHHHKDHIGGLSALVDWQAQSQRPSLTIYGPLQEAIPFRTQAVGQDDQIVILNDVQLRVIEVGGHTLGHIAYFLNQAQPPRLFCGDTLFAGGCGRIFEGTPQQMFTSLQKLAQLPTDSLVCCAHEYTLSNLKFARAVEPSNLKLQEWSGQAQALRDQLKPTVPTSLGLELATNPFLRCHEDAISSAASSFAGSPVTSPVEVFRVIRGWKDGFK